MWSCYRCGFFLGRKPLQLMDMAPGIVLCVSAIDCSIPGLELLRYSIHLTISAAYADQIR